MSAYNNGRWILNSCGYGLPYEWNFKLLPSGSVVGEPAGDVVDESGFKPKDRCYAPVLMPSLQANAIFFNYPGVGASSGPSSRTAAVKAYRAVLAFLEDQQRGLAAKEIICFGYSLGGGIQAEALQRHTFKSDIGYVAVKSKAFSTLGSEVSAIMNPLMGALIRLLGWNIDTATSSKELPVPEVVLQQANVDHYMELSDPTQIKYDDVIPPAASLANALLRDTGRPKAPKKIIGITEGHCEKMGDPSFVSLAIQQARTMACAAGEG